MNVFAHENSIKIIIGLVVSFGVVGFLYLNDLPQDDTTPKQVNQEENEHRVIVNHVVDGDTLVAGGETVRLLGVDAPERGQCYYAEARQKLVTLTLGKAVTLEDDELNEDTDEYGRLLRYVSLPNDTVVNAELIRTGATRHLSWFPIAQNELFSELEQQAKDKGRGLWSVCVDTDE